MKTLLAALAVTFGLVAVAVPAFADRPFGSSSHGPPPVKTSQPGE